jgi:2-C-methyl-D-erythritol 2,4-cyclodiphosphate synthase
MRVGLGFDVHELVADRPLIIGGVEIPYKMGLAGHSDADVLVHAVMDAILGAMGESDIGVHFPDNDPEYKGISSIKLLKRVLTMVIGKGFKIVNIDCTIIAQEPKMSGFFGEMEKNIAEALDISKDMVNVKATTTERLGFTGRGEGIAGQAIAAIEML